jgi:GT2 family glycosyltransferase
VLEHTTELSEVDLAVIIPTHNRREMLLRTLDGLREQTYPADRFEVVVMCDGCEDGTDEALAGLQTPYRLRAFAQPQSGAATARNRAVAKVAAPVVLFFDDDIIAMPELLAEHMRLHNGQEDRVVVGRLLADEEAQPGWSRWEQQSFDRRYRALETNTMPVDGRKFYSGNVSVTRAAFLRVGGFNTTYKRAEDIELGYRLQKAGARFFFNSRAAGIHYGVHSFEAWRRTQYNYGRYDVQLAHNEGHDELMPIADWFRQRNTLNRFLVRAAVGRPALQRSILMLARASAAASDRAGLNHMSRWSYSAIANLKYWQGVADELGGAQKLWRHIASGRTSATSNKSTVHG